LDFLAPFSKAFFIQNYFFFSKTLDKQKNIKDLNRSWYMSTQPLTKYLQRSERIAGFVHRSVCKNRPAAGAELTTIESASVDEAEYCRVKVINKMSRLSVPQSLLFDGNKSVAADWLRKFETTAIWNEDTEEDQLRALPAHMTGTAATWCDALPNGTTTRLDRWKQAFKDRFMFSQAESQRRLRDLNTLRQASGQTLGDFATQVRTFVSGYAIEESQMLTAILQGVDPSILDFLETIPNLTTVEQVITCAFAHRTPRTGGAAITLTTAMLRTW